MKKSTLITSLVSYTLLGLVVLFLFLHPHIPVPKSPFLQTDTPNENHIAAPITNNLIQIPIKPDQAESVSVPGTKIPSFIFDLASEKFKGLGDVTNNGIVDHIQATIVHQAYADTKFDTNVSVDQIKHTLVVNPKNIKNFTPGKYKLSLKLRTLEGEVDIDQDFTWGVIAVNTNKSIYKPGETATISLGVLNDKGDTLCKTGMFNHVDDLRMVITDPEGKETNLALSDDSIRDGGHCGPATVTNSADFLANYKTTNAGIYHMKVFATVFGKVRQIEDYFKVDANVKFDVERTSFPTRIYPPATYPVTFQVTPTSDYQGKVEDVVPASFKIEHISNNGRIEQDGDFTRIIWDANLQAGKTQNFTYFINFPRVSPEYYLLGPIKIGDFQEARQWQIASDAISSATGVVSYEDNATQSTFYRTWGGTTFSAQGTMSSGAGTPTNSKWFSEKSSPLTGEKLVAVLDSDTADTMYVYRWTGSAWVNDIKITMTGNTTSNQSRAVDISYEQNSGDAIFVYANSAATAPNNNKVLYRRRINGTWDSTDRVAGTATAPKAWLRLVSQKNSDNILMGYVNTSNRVGAMIWNGSTKAFTNEIIDDATNSPTAASGHIDQTFDIAWETLSQDAMIAWGNTTTNLTYRKFSGASWSAETTSSLTFPANVDWVTAASDDRNSSNNIAFATQDLAATPNCLAIIWNGSTWSKDTNFTCRAHTTTGGGSSHENAVVFEHGTGKAMWVYIVGTDLNHLHYRTWQSGSFTADTVTNATAPGGAGSTIPAIAVQLYSDSNTVSIMVVYTFAASATSTANCAIWSQEWDGSSWSAPGANNSSANTSMYTNVQAADEHAEAYGFGFDLNIEKLAAYRFLVNTDNTTAGAALTAQDTPYTLTTANQDFRMRVLLYYKDALAISGRSFKLQFVDPGSGTCDSPSGGSPATYTDVGTGGTTSIAFKNNATPADGATVVTNGSDPTYPHTGSTRNEVYMESNTLFTDSVVAISAFDVALYDFALHDNTAYDRVAQTFCFRIVRSSGIVLQLDKYPQITTASINDVLIQGGTRIQGGSKLK